MPGQIIECHCGAVVIVGDGVRWRFTNAPIWRMYTELHLCPVTRRGG